MKLETLRVMVRLEIVRQERLADHQGRLAKLKADYKALKAKLSAPVYSDAQPLMKTAKGKYQELQVAMALSAIYEVDLDQLAEIGKRIRSLLENKESINQIVTLMDSADMAYIALAYILFQSRFDGLELDDSAEREKCRSAANGCLRVLARYSDYPQIRRRD